MNLPGWQLCEKCFVSRFNRVDSKWKEFIWEKKRQQDAMQIVSFCKNGNKSRIFICLILFFLYVGEGGRVITKSASLEQVKKSFHLLCNKENFWKCPNITDLCFFFFPIHPGTESISPLDVLILKPNFIIKCAIHLIAIVVCLTMVLFPVLSSFDSFLNSIGFWINVSTHLVSGIRYGPVALPWLNFVQHNRQSFCRFIHLLLLCIVAKGESTHEPL